MASFKAGRMGEDIKRELTAIFRELKDPRIAEFITIVRVDLSNDLSHCKNEKAREEKPQQEEQTDAPRSMLILPLA